MAILRPEAKVLFLSGHADEILASHGVSGAAVLRKPFTPGDLVQKAWEALAR